MPRSRDELNLALAGPTRLQRWTVTITPALPR
jgi:hypothetical protein